MTAPVAPRRRRERCAPRRHGALRASPRRGRLASGTCPYGAGQGRGASARTGPARRCPQLRQAPHRVRPARRRSVLHAAGSSEPEGGPRDRSAAGPRRLRQHPRRVRAAALRSHQELAHEKGIHVASPHSHRPPQARSIRHRRARRPGAGLRPRRAVARAGAYIHKSCVTGRRHRRRLRRLAGERVLDGRATATPTTARLAACTRRCTRRVGIPLGATVGWTYTAPPNTTISRFWSEYAGWTKIYDGVNQGLIQFLDGAGHVGLVYNDRQATRQQPADDRLGPQHQRRSPCGCSATAPAATPDAPARWGGPRSSGRSSISPTTCRPRSAPSPAA